ncbi:MAG: pirin family protein [Leptospiraceae bacterium]|nr:pirin family protein [Leptospiraceae bacterium]
MVYREIQNLLTGMPAEDGAGVKLSRIIANPMLSHVDPVLLLDEFKSENPEDYIAGFPPHPHRGFETITYMKQGNFRHQDSAGNTGHLGPGSVQWMTAGRGIIHSEMPAMQDGMLWGFQLWLNLPAQLKMTEPRYQDIESGRIPVVKLPNNQGQVKVLAGFFGDTKGAGQSRTPFTYWDVELEPNANLTAEFPANWNVFIYAYAGDLQTGNPEQPEHARSGQLAVYRAGTTLYLQAGEQGCGLLCVAAEPLGEAIARSGPFVMNTRDEIMQAYEDYQSGRLAAGL